MTEEIVPSMASLVSRFTQRERVYPDDPRLLRAYDPENRPCVIVADPSEPIHVARFDSEAERDAWLEEVKASAIQKQRRRTESGGGSAAPAIVAIGGA
ncbi:hypothetical protein [Armatimonas sp.]|uniref:hypothetical protein n=1 Tax=Armatimonas sp. TaxID=1872638 RepID=UPI003750CD84